MSITRICICSVQVPFVRGGAEFLVDSLKEALRSRGFTTDVINLPFKWYPSSEVLSHALAWRLLDLSESQG
ncbi:MAG TPA: glycosyltransferase family 1 protein, partial [Dehalococcoidia bacterium]|nr:glycosyltransferase family 1 protein [Dehalococcoidia bacterium]